MAKSSMVTSTIPKSLIYHGNKDAYDVMPQVDCRDEILYDELTRSTENHNESNRLSTG